jgi:hypothetical protein
MTPNLLRGRIVAAAIICAVAVALASGQGTVTMPQPDMRQVGTAAISGVVVDADTGQPLPGVVVHLGRTPRGPIGFQNRQVSDSRGRFVFVDQPAGEGFTLSGSKPGYLTPAAPPVPTGVGSIALAQGQWIGDARLVMRRAGVIEGIVTDERGEPVAGVEIRTVALIDIAGRDQLASGPAAMTDDRGRYRLGGLLPGRYLVAVPSLQASVSATATQASVLGMNEAVFAGQPAARARSLVAPIFDAADGMRVVLGRHPVPPPVAADGQRFGYPLTFHPGTTDLDQATPVDVGASVAGQTADIQLRPSPTGYLRGRVEGPGQIANLLVRLVTHPELGLGFETATARTHVDGTFAFANVPVGTYSIDVPAVLSEYQHRASSGPGDAANRPPGLGSFNSRSSVVRGAPPGTSITSYSSGGVSFAAGAVSATEDNSAGLRARDTVTVRAGDSPDVVVTLRPTATIAGRIVFEGDIAGLAPGALNANVAADPANGSASLGLPNAFADRNDPSFPFVVRAVAPGVYFLRQAFQNQWTIKAIRFNGEDYFERRIDLSDGRSMEGVVVTVTRAAATIQGTVRRPADGSWSDAHAVVFPTDRSAWTDFGLQPPRLATTQVSQTGTFRFTGLPAGEYYAATVRESELATWRRADVLARMAATAARVTADWGQVASVNLEQDR